MLYHWAIPPGHIILKEDPGWILTRVWKPEINLKLVPLSKCYSPCGRQCLSLAWFSPSRRGRPASEPQDHPASTSSELRLQGSTTRILTWVLGIKPGASHLAKLVILPTELSPQPIHWHPIVTRCFLCELGEQLIQMLYVFSDYWCVKFGIFNISLNKTLIFYISCWKDDSTVSYQCIPFLQRTWVWFSDTT